MASDKPARPERPQDNIAASSLQIAQCVSIPRNLIEEGDVGTTSTKAGTWRTEHGLGAGSNQTLMVTLNGARDLTGSWRHHTRLEIKVMRGADQVELRAVLMAPFFNEVELFEVDGQPSADMGRLSETFDTAKRLMGIEVPAGAEERAMVAETRGALGDVTQLD